MVNINTANTLLSLVNTILSIILVGILLSLVNTLNILLAMVNAVNTHLLLISVITFNEKQNMAFLCDTLGSNSVVVYTIEDNVWVKSRSFEENKENILMLELSKVKVMKLQKPFVICTVYRTLCSIHYQEKQKGLFNLILQR